MAKTFIGVRIEPEIKEKLEAEAERTGLTLTEITERALSAYLDVDTGANDLTDVYKRLERLERKIGTQQKTTPKKKDPLPPVPPEELGELITKKEAEALTGYSVNTLNRTFSQKGVHEVDKRGKAGLYRKSDIIEKIGFK